MIAPTAPLCEQLRQARSLVKHEPRSQVIQVIRLTSHGEASKETCAVSASELRWIDEDIGQYEEHRTDVRATDYTAPAAALSKASFR